LLSFLQNFVFVYDFGNISCVDVEEEWMIKQTTNGKVSLRFRFLLILWCLLRILDQVFIKLSFGKIEIILGFIFETMDSLEDQVNLIVTTKGLILISIVLSVSLRVVWLSLLGSNINLFIKFLLSIDSLLEVQNILEIFILFGITLLFNFLLFCYHFLLKDKLINISFIIFLFFLRNFIFGMKAFVEYTFQLGIYFHVIEYVINWSNKIIFFREHLDQYPSIVVKHLAFNLQVVVDSFVSKGAKFNLLYNDLNSKITYIDILKWNRTIDVISAPVGNVFESVKKLLCPEFKEVLIVSKYLTGFVEELLKSFSRFDVKEVKIIVFISNIIKSQIWLEILRS